MIRHLALSLLLLITCLAVAQPAVQAKDLFGQACNQSTANAAACKDNSGDNPLTGSGGALVGIANIVSIVAGGAAIIILIISAIRYITSGGDAGQVKSAREGVVGAIIGLAIIVLARSLIAFVLDRL